MKKYTITIDAEFGSDFQEEYFEGYLETAMAITKSTHEMKHKKNKMDYTIE